MSNGKKHSIGRQLLFSFVLVSAFAALLEFGARVLIKSSESDNPREIEWSDRYGWKSSADQHFEGTFDRYGSVNYTTTHDGFRVFGDPRSNRIKIWAIGDSQTQARKVSDGSTYYNYVGRSLDAEIFAYGAGGFGSLQEQMILDDYLDVIDPDIILWQFCNNDIHNNSWDLESRSWTNNNRMVRPYLEKNEVVFRFPHDSWLYRNLLRHSVLVQSTNINLALALTKNTGILPADILTDDSPVFRNAVATTQEIMQRVRKRARSRSVVAFLGCANSNSSYRNLDMDGYFRSISTNAGIQYVAGIPDLLERAKSAGITVDGDPIDRHWNSEGHRIAGSALVSYLIESGTIESRQEPDPLPSD